ncbi:hypothetical protein MYSTI_06119 [Myxococcus stipitatus DSM 14675]|uniref:Urease accessory protein UreH-like transmembrane domain-containing protein n=1 Tax=Myxococcus stipitatus (strain DSM 14675 / JCM 12634 / Mx s8) TaxID=1278073 RepID=L7UIM1_MYXSD|nr:sulfite exporter TauE/SafE family protein [Myxococcus stipitatus]AGC47392.1 hypothetical protein MYSTI_06119 [Myxococcus stipitatus DSM 14675]
MSIDVPALLASLVPTPTLLTAAVGALTVGLTGSVHCFLMCGPLACASLPSIPGADRRRALLAYQGARLGAYALVGGLLGALGGGVARALAVSTRPYLPWLMIAALVASALDLGKRLPPLPGLARLARGLSRWSAKFSWTVRAGAMGAVTPLLPCGLLYGVFAVALASGSFAGGALVMGAFAVGGLPALFVAQLQWGLWSKRPRLSHFLLKRAMPLTAAVVLAVRAVETSGSCH